MGTDEYDKERGSSMTMALESIIVPLACVIAVLAAIHSAVGSMSARDTFEALRAIAATNHILQAFIASSLLGICSWSVVATSRSVVSYLRGRTFCSITISNKDESFEKVIEFIGKQGIVQSGCLIASTHQKKKTWKDWRTEFLMGDRAPPRMNYQPANNNDVHVIKYAGARILMHRHKGETVVAGWERLPMQMETLTLSSWGAHVSPLKQLIDDALRASFAEEQDELSVFVLSDMWGGSWEKALSKKPRAIESVILDKDLASDLLADARDFLGAATWYESVGIPYRRGYLLYGPPGCGKTSFCQALAGALKLDVCMLTLSNKNLDDNGLAESLRDAPANAIVLLEDVDAVFVDRAMQHEGGGRSAGVTFSGLLNALDGVASQEGRLFFMTTNHIEKLDPALIRPGRCDVKVEVKRASRTQASGLYKRFYPDAPHADAQRFASSLPAYELSMATLQGYLLEHKSDPSGALTHVSKLLTAACKPKSVDTLPILEHLRRVGLEGWAGLFVFHGYHTRSDVRGLSLDTVKQWSGYLRIDQQACTRLGQLLGEESALMAEYQLVDMATAKEMFMAAFVSSEAAVAAADDGVGAVAMMATGGNGQKALTDTSSEDTSSSGDEDEPSDPCAGGASSPRPTLGALADTLCAALQREGKACASVWQLRRHLHLHAHSAADAAATAGVLIAPQPPCGVDAADVDALSTYDWLRRAGLEACASALEDKGYTTARMLYGLSDELITEACGGDKESLQRSALKALTHADHTHARTLLGFTAADYQRLRTAFLTACAAEEDGEGGGASDATAVRESHAILFARSLSDAAGHGRISIRQLEAYLASAAARGAAHAASHAAAELLEHVRVTPPPVVVEEPTGWLHEWLKEHKLHKYAACLADANFVERADLMMAPRLDLKELEALGVDKAADRRRLCRLIEQLS